MVTDFIGAARPFLSVLMRILCEPKFSIESILNS